MDDAPDALDADDLARHARVVAGIAAGRPAAEVLAEVGLSEDEHSRLEERVEEALSRALAATRDAPPPFLVAYERALRDAHAAAHEPPPISIDELLGALAALGSATDPRRALDALGLDPAAVARAASHHAARLAADPALAARLASLLSSVGGSARGSTGRDPSRR